MLAKQESRRGEHPERPSGCVCLAADTPEDAFHLLDRQALWLAHKLGLKLDRARLLVGLAFAVGARP